MPDYSRVEPILQRYLERWMESPTAKRISDVEFAAIASGRAAEWEGISVTDFWIDILREYTETLRANPELLRDTQAENAAFRVRFQQFLEDEQKLIDRADELKEMMSGYALGALDPRWHKAKKELHDVVGKFRLVDENYQLNTNSIPKPPNGK